MKIPKSVKIGGLTYAVKDNVKRLSIGCMCSAEINYQALVIEISESGSRERRERDFLHEIIHGIYDNLGYTDHDEKKIDELAGALHQVIVDNPGVFK